MTVTSLHLRLLSALTAIRWRARSSSLLRARFVLFIGNQSSLAVLVKSRSSSRRVNGVARKAAAILLGASPCTRTRTRIATLRTQALAASMPQQRAPVVRRAVHTAGDIVLCAFFSIVWNLVGARGSLQQLRVQLKTRCRYKDAVGAFSSWLHDNDQSPASDKDDLDSQLCQYLEWLWREGAHVGWAGDAISCCQFFLQKRRYFPAAWDLFRIWEREEPLCQATRSQVPSYLPSVLQRLHGI